MSTLLARSVRRGRTAALALTLVAAAAVSVNAQAPQPKGLPAETPAAITKQPEAGPPARSGAKMQRLTGVWIEGPGFDVTYGHTYDSCAKRCLDNQKCLMIEFYTPEKKCNLYSTIRPRIRGGSSIVGIRD